MATLVPEPAGSDNSITALLQLSARNREVETQIFYGESHRLAARYMRAERRNHTLQPTALVNEAYTFLVQQPQVLWQSQVHFFAATSQVMRHNLVDYARKRRAVKCGFTDQRVEQKETRSRAQEYRESAHSSSSGCRVNVSILVREAICRGRHSPRLEEKPIVQKDPA